jgi:hypothetical protein
MDPGACAASARATTRLSSQGAVKASVTPGLLLSQIDLTGCQSALSAFSPTASAGSLLLDAQRSAVSGGRAIKG